MSEEKRKKSNGRTLSFHNGYFGDSFWPKTTGGNVIKYPARYGNNLIIHHLFRYMYSTKINVATLL